MSRRFGWVGVAFGMSVTVLACAAPTVAESDSADENAAATASSASPVIDDSFMTPSEGGLQPVIDSIAGATTSIRMAIYHLTVPAVVDALAAAAKRHVDVQIIIDQDNWTNHTPKAIKTELSQAGVTVFPSSTGFRITHEKSFVVDEKVATIMSLNLTSPYVQTRDYAVVTHNKAIVKEFLSVFETDVANAKDNGTRTPTLTNPNLAWSPVNSQSKLAAFVDAAKTSLLVSSENLGDPVIQAAMVRAAGRGVAVRVIAPLCDQNVNPEFDLPILATLIEGGIEARAMPSPPSPSQPYIHAKMMLADGKRAFVGSVNFSTASTTNAREVGIFFADHDAIAMISSAFEQDWALGVTPPASSDANCPAATP